MDAQLKWLKLESEPRGEALRRMNELSQQPAHQI